MCLHVGIFKLQLEGSEDLRLQLVDIFFLCLSFYKVVEFGSQHIFFPQTCSIHAFPYVLNFIFTPFSSSSSFVWSRINKKEQLDFS